MTRLSSYLIESSLGVPGAGHYQPHLTTEETEGKGSHLSKGTAREWGKRDGNQGAWLLSAPLTPYHRAPQHAPHSQRQEQKPARRVRTRAPSPMPGFRSWLCHLLVVRSWASYSTLCTSSSVI